MYLHAIIQLNFVFILTISQKKKCILSRIFYDFYKKKIECKNFGILILIIPTYLYSIASIGTSVIRIDIF